MALMGSGLILGEQAPVALLFWGRQVLPVQVQSLSIKEQAFDVRLNPIRASADMSLRVLTYRDMTIADPGYWVFMASFTQKEVLAAINTVGSAESLGAVLPSESGAMFTRGSRYEAIKDAEFVDRNGRTIRFKRMRFVVPPIAPLAMLVARRRTARPSRAPCVRRLRAILAPRRREPDRAPGRSRRTRQASQGSRSGGLRRGDGAASRLLHRSAGLRAAAAALRPRA